MTKPTQLMPELLIMREMASDYAAGYNAGYAACMEDLVKTINSLNSAKERREKPSNGKTDEQS